MKSRTRKDPFQIPKMEIFKSNEPFCNFYPDLPKTFFIFKMSKNKAQIWNKHHLNTRNGNFQVKWIILYFLSEFAENFFYTQHEQEQSPNMKRAPLKYPKWSFSSQMHHSAIFTQIYLKLSLYTRWAKAKCTFETSTF